MSNKSQRDIPVNDQENLLCLLTHFKRGPEEALSMVKPEQFEGDYRTFAEKIFEFWQRYDEPPKDHLPDLLADVLLDPHNRRGQALRRVILSLWQLSETLNPAIRVELDRRLHHLAGSQGRNHRKCLCGG